MPAYRGREEGKGLGKVMGRRGGDGGEVHRYQSPTTLSFARPVPYEKREKNIFFLEECIHNGVVLGLQPAGPLGTILNSLGKILKPAS